MTGAGNVARRAGAVLIMTLVTLVAGFVPGTANATPVLALDVNGTGFTSGPTAPLLDIHALAPGLSRSGTVGLQNPYSTNGALHLRLIDLQDDENGCVPAELAADDSCGLPGPGTGELSLAIVWSIAVANAGSGPYIEGWSGSTAGLESGVDLRAIVPAGGQRYLRLTATLPMTAGNEVQTDSVSFGTRISITGDDGTAGVSVLGNHASTPDGRLHAVSPGTPGIDIFGASGSYPASLAFTGVPAIMFLGAGLLLLASGLLLGSAARRRRMGLDSTDVTA